MASADGAGGDQSAVARCVPMTHSEKERSASFHNFALAPIGRWYIARPPSVLPAGPHKLMSLCSLAWAQPAPAASAHGVCRASEARCRRLGVGSSSHRCRQRRRAVTAAQEHPADAAQLQPRAAQADIVQLKQQLLQAVNRQAAGLPCMHHRRACRACLSCGARIPPFWHCQRGWVHACSSFLWPAWLSSGCCLLCPSLPSHSQGQQPAAGGQPP